MNENNLNEKPKRERLTRREKRARWKAAKKAKKQEIREYYRYAPWPKRVWNLWLKKLVKTVFFIVLVVGLLAANMEAIVGGIVVPAIRSYYNSVKNRPLAEEDIAKIYELAPIDEQGSARIDALPAIGADETWTISVYFVGADLEDDGENDLSYVTSVLTKDLKAKRGEEKRQELIDKLTRFNGELAENGLELPRFYYYPDVPVASSTVVTEEVHVSERLGKVSGDIAELCSGPWSDRIQIVMQTGGATHWSNNMINPNRTQRFLYKNGEFSEVADLPLQPAAETETLADFLRFSRDEYPADHNILILWNHGGGPFGFGMDSIYGGMFSLKDIRAALESVYQARRRKARL